MEPMHNEERTMKPTRTCVGCHRRATAGEELVRIVLGARGDDGRRPVVVDVAGTAFGRGAHVHPKTDCVRKACSGGLARAFKCEVVAVAGEIASQIGAGCDRRIEGLLMAARRARFVAVGDEARDAMKGGAPLAVVACDAGAAVTREYAPAVAAGRAIAWKDKAALGALVGRDEAAAVVVRDAGIAHEIVRVRAVAGSVSSK